jgi:hypothetical protein
MFLKSSYEREIARFFQKLKNNEVQIKEATKGALSQARAKLNPWAFKRLNEVTYTTFYDEAEYLVWHDFRVLSIDGSTLRLPNTKEIKKEFGTYKAGPKADSEVAVARCSMLYDVFNQIVLSAEIKSYDTSEIAFVYESHMDKIQPGDLILADRLYGSYRMFFQLIEKGADFCIRMKNDWWNVVREFQNSNSNDKIVELTIPAHQAKEFGIEIKTMKCRLVKVKLDNGQTEILCTSLTDQVKYSVADFKSLYDARWTEEEAYKLLKARIELEDFTGKTSRSVYQDFYAKIFMMTCCASFCHPISEKIRIEHHKEKTKQKHSKMLNKTSAMSSFRDAIVNFFVKPIKSKIIVAYDELIYSYRIAIQENRKFERKKKPKKLYSPNYKGI